MLGLECGSCPDQCESVDYEYTTTFAKFSDPRDFFYKALLR